MNENGTDRVLVTTVRKQKLQYMIRAQKLCTYIFENHLDGARCRGRPCRRWGDNIKQGA